ncbi:helix-turn-helix domain-containing protein [Galbibacter sp. BG1]|uniref:helix-turn-helix domain-containing protein n=1 Tax=Galbibacter sp. BG1 TaxID=1170699 RepID=UPI0015B931E5|nr:helix-turn-helix domain-containing protein [Galbibacter sp. BG1]QLE01989.1 helix-turn-helix domain-containing protein [Galbibacter sp. BG1]
MKLIAYVESGLQENIKIRIAISLKILLQKSKLLTKDEKDLVGNSYNTIALNAGIRKATVTDIFNAKSSPNATTLFLIIEAMGHKLNDFSKIYDSLRDREIQDFKKKKTSQS